MCFLATPGVKNPHQNSISQQTPNLLLTWGLFKSLRPRQNGRHFADNIFNCISLNENVWVPIKISLKFVPKGPINNIPALVQIMAWCRPGDKPLSEPTMVSLPTHIWVTRPQWVNIKILSYQYRKSYYEDKTIYDCLIFIMVIPILGKMVLILKQGPGYTSISMVFCHHAFNNNGISHTGKINT